MPGDDWSVIVSIANSAANPLADQHGTAISHPYMVSRTSKSMPAKGM